MDGILAANQKTSNSANQASGDHHSHDSAAQARHDKDIPSANSVLEAQNDMLETVKQLLQQTQKVIFLFHNEKNYKNEVKQKNFLIFFVIHVVISLFSGEINMLTF